MHVGWPWAPVGQSAALAHPPPVPPELLEELEPVLVPLVELELELDAELLVPEPPDPFPEKSNVPRI
jgi:hypothetical protein